MSTSETHNSPLQGSDAPTEHVLSNMSAKHFEPSATLEPPHSHHPANSDSNKTRRSPNMSVQDAGPLYSPLHPQVAYDVDTRLSTPSTPSTWTNHLSYLRSPSDQPMHSVSPAQEYDPLEFVPDMAYYLFHKENETDHNNECEGRARKTTSAMSRKTASRSPSAASTPTPATVNQQPVPEQPHFVFNNGANETDDSEATDDGIGQANMLEQTHGVSHREGQRPAKKLKTDHTTDAADTFHVPEKGGVVGQWLKERRNEPSDITNSTASQSEEVQTVNDNEDEEPVNSQTARKRNIVDLTAEDDDVVMQPTEDDREVCYGKVDGAQAYAHTIPHPKDHAGVTNDGTMWKVLFCSVFREPLRHNIIHLRDPHHKTFATVDTRVARALAPLLDTKFLRLRVDARLDPRKRRSNDYIGKEVSEYWKLTLNLYGPKKHVTTIGKALSQKNVWLSHPYGVRYGTEIMNPHAADRAALTKVKWTQQVRAGGGGTGYVVRTNEEVAQDLNGIFNSLSNADDLEALEPHHKVKTELLDHQKRALRFMTNRETVTETRDGDEIIPGNPLWRMRISESGRRSYYNVITGNEQPHPPEPVLGGILADQMGLGKTLEAIAFICSTLDEAQKWEEDSKDKADERGLKLHSVKTTLLICPKNVCSEWQDQIDLHLQKSTLKSYFYHGSDRCRDVKVLSKYDMVITTYSIVSNELRRAANSKSNSIFATTKWFRIVLDEAHVIREQSTQQSKAICSLAASRRWALTGTPVQNRLEDLGALIKFLRIKPFDEPSAFVQYIMTSFKMKDETALQKLRLLVDSFTLRRLKDKIDLPPREELTEELEFSPDEAALHNWFTKDAGNKMRLMQSKKRTLAGRSYQNVLRSILCLRLVSVHGRELLHEDDLQMIQGISSEQPIDLDVLEESQPALTARAAYEMLMLMDSAGRQVCNRCGKAVRPSEDDDDKDLPFGYMLPCYDIVCKDCIKGIREQVEETARDERFTCPFCESTQKLSFFSLTQAGVEEAEGEREQAKLNPRQAKILGRYRGPHTKTMALLRHLEQDARESSIAQSQDETPVKSVVFTEWTSHMDLIEIALEDRAPDVKMVRFDGKMSVRQQTAALEKFRNDPSVGVIVVSIRAGGVGLNLTAACRVYVMEPQWNPAAEAQAVDRVHRLGQRRPVTITRFIMSNSIEQTMLKLQGKKKRLAEVSLNRNVGKGAIAAETMDEFRDLFSRRL